LCFPQPIIRAESLTLEGLAADRRSLQITFPELRKTTFNSSLAGKDCPYMPVHRRIELSTVAGATGEVTVVRFVDRKILDAANIQELGDELFALVDKDKRKLIILNFVNVEFLSSAALNKLIMMERMVKNSGGKIRFCSLRPEIFEVFAITKLNQLFDIKPDEKAALVGL
jgi:anti-sigma B factor antagonist